MEPQYVHVGSKVVDTRTGEVIQTDTDQRSRAQRTLELYGFNVTSPEPFQAFTPEELTAPGDVNWHYSGEDFMYGSTRDGKDYEYSYLTGKSKRIYPLDKKRQAMACANIRGAAFASRRYDIPAGTIRSWTKRAALCPQLLFP